MSTAPALAEDRRRRLTGVLERLRRRTGATRTTLRIDFDGWLFPVEVECLADGTGSIKGDETFDLRKAPSSRAVLDSRQMLVQEDCTEGPFAPPPEFVELYDVRAQIICPIVRDERVVAILSVHSRQGPRRWSEEDRALTEAAAAACEELIG